MTHLARSLLILMAIVLYVPWRIWIFGGWIADRRAQRRHARTARHRTNPRGPQGFQMSIIRRPYERFAAGILAFFIGFLLIPISIYVRTIAETVVGLLWWSFGK